VNLGDLKNIIESEKLLDYLYRGNFHPEVFRRGIIILQKAITNPTPIKNIKEMII
jgi:hypothetical protein